MMRSTHRLVIIGHHSLNYRISEQKCIETDGSLIDQYSLFLYDFLHLFGNSKSGDWLWMLDQLVSGAHCF